VGPAGGLDNPIADEQLIEPSVAIGVNDASLGAGRRRRLWFGSLTVSRAPIAVICLVRL
jgi:hypothetical protein